jgi:hypothetical protein
MTEAISRALAAGGGTPVSGGGCGSSQTPRRGGAGYNSLSQIERPNS